MSNWKNDPTGAKRPKTAAESPPARTETPSPVSGPEPSQSRSGFPLKPLRTRAEKPLAKTLREVPAMTVADMQKLVHELQVRQTELEIQNDELRQLNETFEKHTAKRPAALMEAQAELQQAQRLAHLGSWYWDAKTDQVSGSEQLARMYGVAPETRLPFNRMKELFFPVKDWDRINVAVQEVLRTGAGYELDVESLRDGTPFWVTTRAEAVRAAAGTIVGLRGTVQDITERKQAEQLLRRANRTLQIIRDCHEAMLRAGSERELLDAICRIIVQSGGERMAWVACAEKNARKTVQTAALAGVCKDYLTKAHIAWANAPRGRGPVGTAIRTGRVSLCHNTLTDPNFAPWRAGARRCGYGSVIALPLKVDGLCVGALCIYTAEASAFDATEQRLLTDLANDLAFGISLLRLRAERERLEAEVVKSVQLEQERIGRDLHDGLCQMLVGAKYRAGILQWISRSQFPEVKQQASALEEILNQTMVQARALSRSLNPARITSANLVPALHGLAGSVDGAHGTRCSCQFPKPVKIPNSQVADQLYRIAQEAVQNALKHAGAKHIAITLTRRDGRVLLGVQDDGVGIALRRKRSGTGLRNMETRARLIGGRLEVARRERGGTAVSCELPIRQDQEPRP